MWTVGIPAFPSQLPGGGVSVGAPSALSQLPGGLGDAKVPPSYYSS